MEWKTIKGYENYEISDTGQIRNKKNQRLLHPHQSRFTGYVQVTLRKDNKSHTLYVHRLVLETFNPIQDETMKEVNHKDFDKTNNSIDNLEWVTHQLNMSYGYDKTKRKLIKEISDAVIQILNKYITTETDE